MYGSRKDYECSFWMGLALVNDKGGIYIATDIIVTEEILNLYDKDFTVIYTKRESGGNQVAVIMGNSKDKKLQEFRKSYNIHQKYEKEIPVACSPIDSRLTFMKTGPCHVIETEFHPEDIWSLSCNFGDFARKMLYGSTTLMKPRSFLPGNIPKTAHYVWFGKKEMDFSMYLSMLSTLFIANVVKVFIHGDDGLYGKYFEKILQDQRLRTIKHQPPQYIYGHQIYHIEHRSDIIRADVLLKYGGIYVDWDVVWLQDPDDIIQQGYDAVANYDHMPHKGFPNTINLGVLMAKPRSTFVKRWQDALVDYKSRDFLYNAVLLPYKIYEKYPLYLYIEKRLQVMCNFLRCHPVFHPQFKAFHQDQPFDWQTDVYSVHFTYPNPPEWSSEETCRNSTGRFAEIGRYVLQHERKLGIF